MPLLVLGHVDPDHRPLVVEHELGERAGELGLADAGRAEEDERADRAIGVLQPGARATERVRDGLDRLVLADHALVQPFLHVDQLLGLALEQPGDRDTRPGRDDRRDVVLVDLLLHHRLGRRLALGELLLERGQLAVADLGDPLEVAGALGALGLHPQLVDPRRDLADPVERGLLLGPACRRARAWRSFASASWRSTGSRTSFDSFAIAASSISSWRTARSAWSSSSGELSISIFRREAASSTRSIALSGSCRSAM